MPLVKGQTHAGSKKRRYAALFDLAKPRLASGEVVLIQLEADGLGLQVFSDQHTLRIYWGQWRKAQKWLAQGKDDWLDEVMLSMRESQGHFVMQLIRRSTIEELALGKATIPHSTLMLTGQGASFARNRPAPVPEGMEEKAAQMNAEADAANAAREPWVEWAVKEAPQDAFKHLDAFNMPFDSPEAQAYRAKHGG